jgi:hypothetical protein
MASIGLKETLAYQTKATESAKNVIDNNYYLDSATASYYNDMSKMFGVDNNSPIKINNDNTGVAQPLTDDELLSSLGPELEGIEGLHAQDPDTAKKLLPSVLSKYKCYTNRLFGAPYQLLDSVDRRFKDLNPYVGTEYLRHFLLNSPILHIRPGMPKYTGGDDPNSIKNIATRVALAAGTNGGITGWDELKLGLEQRFLFYKGDKLQRRMFSFRETYYDYMMHVNYMCRSVATLMDLTDTAGDNLYTSGTFANDPQGNYEFEPFEKMRWENYRMTNRYVRTTAEQFGAMLAKAPVIKQVLELGSFLKDVFTPDSFKNYEKEIFGPQNIEENGFYDVMKNKVKSVLFLVEPVSFTETLQNQTAQSFIESMADGLQNSVGSEIAFMTNSKADTGILDEITGFLSNGVETIGTALGGLVSPVTGGFVQNLFSAGAASLKGQKMIYPDIYKSSNSTMNYNFSITLSSPYGDKYNYYMNIIVPLMHLIALAAPRMTTSNNVASPFLVQAFIPGMCSCQLGIIENMTITKNPSTKHVSINGFPLTIKVDFTIKELYNAMAISPANDPSSFMYNETLNDYMANIAGLIPSLDTHTKHREAALKAKDEFFKLDKLVDEGLASIMEGIENFANPYA